MLVLNFDKGNAHIYWNSYARTVRITRKGRAVVEIVDQYLGGTNAVVKRYISSGTFSSVKEIEDVIDAEYRRQWYGEEDQE
jgi:hypothetical protein